MSYYLIRTGVVLVAAFFLVMGIDLLRAAYRLENPAWFIMTFFASNLVILISAALGGGFLWNMISTARRRNRPDSPPEEADDDRTEE